MKFLLFLIAIASAQQQCLDSADTYINKRCFKLVNQPMSWQDARNWCHYRNPVTSSYLATVIDKTTANFLASIARTAFNINDGLFWIGLSRYNSSSRWQWDDGTPFVWSNFDANNNQNLNYAAESITNGKWVTKYGDEKYNFVCSYDPNAQPGTTGTPGTASWGTTVPIEQTTENDWTTTSDGPTPTEEVCTTTTPSTLLYAYSNDLDVTFVQQSLDNIIRFNKQLSYRYKTFANVRLDSREGRGISYSSIDSFNSSVSAQLPDPSVAINDTNIGSDILKYLQDFAENQHVPTCGALVFVLAKRYPIDQDVSYLVSLLQKKHIFVYIIAQNIPSGGNSPHVLYNLSARTNGYCIFAGGSEFGYTANQAMGAIYRQYQFLSQSFVVSGAGRKTIPLIRSPKTVGYEQIMVAITIQNQRKDNHYKSLNYTISAVQGDYQFTGPTSQWPLWGTGILAAPQMNASMDYTMTIDYKYSEDQPQNVEVRMQSSYFFPDWLPFSN